MDDAKGTMNAEHGRERNEKKQKKEAVKKKENADNGNVTSLHACYIFTPSSPAETPADEVSTHPPKKCNSETPVAVAGEIATTIEAASDAAATATTAAAAVNTATSVTVINAGCARNVNTLAQSQLKSPLQRVQPILPEANAEVSSLEAPPLEAQQTPEAPRLPSGQEINAKNTLQSNAVVAVEATVTATTTATESAASSDFYKQMYGIGGTRMGIDVTVVSVVAGVVQHPILSSQQQPPRRTSRANTTYLFQPSHLSRPPHLPTSATSVSTLNSPVGSVPQLYDDTTVFANACILEDEGSPGCEISQTLPIQSISPDSTTVVTSANSRVSGSTNASTVDVGLVKTQPLPRRRSAVTLALTSLIVAIVILGMFCGTGSCSSRSTAYVALSTNETPQETRAPSTNDTLQETRASTTNDALQETRAPKSNDSPQPSARSEEMSLLSVSDYIQNVTLSGRKIAVLSSRTSKHKRVEELALKWLMYEDPLALQPTNVTNRFRIRQRYALLTLFMRQHNKEGHQRRHPSVTNASINECEWLGVTCQTRESASGEGTFDMVTAIVLPAQQLSGRLPLDLGLLSDSLTHLDVSHNNFYGSLPESFDQCTNMERIDLSYNQDFVGSIPSSWGTQWTNLRHFSIAASNLTGSLPTDLGHWTLLKHFNVEQNKLTGPIPSVWGEQWTKLEHFSVGANSQDVSRFNRLTGTIPEALSRWTNLLSFNVARNSLVGTLPHSLQQWSALEIFDVSENKVLYGTLPAVYGTAWSSLRYADLSNNEFGGTLPRPYSRWTRLEYLDVNDNEMTGFLSDSWAQWTNLRYLSIRANQFRGEIPQPIGAAWSKLESIDVGFNRLVGSLPKSIVKWTSLLSFRADDNDLTGSLPSSIGQWKELTDINVARNQLTGTLPDSIGQWSRLSVFSIRSNSFIGTIPKVVEGWTMVESIYLDNNDFSGTMPDGICQTDFTVLAADCQYALTCSCCTWCSSTWG